jgi:hypothetical protein
MFGTSPGREDDEHAENQEKRETKTNKSAAAAPTTSDRTSCRTPRYSRLGFRNCVSSYPIIW